MFFRLLVIALLFVSEFVLGTLGTLGNKVLPDLPDLEVQDEDMVGLVGGTY